LAAIHAFKSIIISSSSDIACVRGDAKSAGGTRGGGCFEVSLMAAPLVPGAKVSRVKLRR
jgi:hypothetical protein